VLGAWDWDWRDEARDGCLDLVSGTLHEACAVRCTACGGVVGLGRRRKLSILGFCGQGKLGLGLS
jgi:hypothetical protein